MQIRIKIYHMVHIKEKGMVCNKVVVKMCKQIMNLVLNSKLNIKNKFIIKILGTIHKGHLGINKHIL